MYAVKRAQQEKGNTMKTVYINLPTIETVQDFVVQISPLEGNFDLLEKNYILDAKSLMGILSLDLSKPLKLAVERDTAEAMQAIGRFISVPSSTAS